MRKIFLKLAAANFALSAIWIATPVSAQAEKTVPDIAEEEAPAGEEGPITVDITISAVSDYRFRGVSLSDKDPAIQAGATISHESGLYIGAWASNIAENYGDDIEVDIFAGFSGGDTVTYDIGATYYVFPGASAFNYMEAIGRIGTTVGPVDIGGIVAYTPSQDGTGDADNVYIGTDASIDIPNSVISVAGSVGYENGAFGDDKIDWSLGLSAPVTDYLVVSAQYVDTNRLIGGLGKAGAVFGATMSF